MKVETRVSRTHVITTDDGTEYIVDHRPAEYGPDPIIVDRGEGVVEIGYVVDDEMPFDPFEDDEGVMFRDAYDRTLGDLEEFVAGRQAAGWTVFAVEAYRHSGVHYSLAHEGAYPDRRWDVSQSAAIALDGEWQGDLREIARGLLERYNAYVSGDTYLIAVARYENGKHVIASEPYGDELLGGYYGVDEAIEGLADNFGIEAPA